MKRVLVLAAVLALLAQPGLAFTRALPAPEYATPDAGEVVAADDPVAPDPGAAKTPAREKPEPQGGGMPGWPILAFCTASMVSPRIVLAIWSCSDIDSKAVFSTMNLS